MFDFHEKRRIRTLLYSRSLSIAVIIASIFLGNAVYHRFSVAQEMREKLEITQKEMRNLEQRAEALEAKVEYLKDERGIEEELRNRFDVVKEGEQMVVFIEEESEKAQKSLENDPNIDTEKSKNFLETLKFW